jgi:hypothetical protein
MRRVWIVAAGVALAGVVAETHHSIAGAYDSSKQVTVEGVIVRFQFVNPHPFVTMEVADAAGATLPWHLEMDNRRELSGVGVTPSTLSPGDRIIVTGSPSRTQPNSLYVRRLDRPADGFWYEQVGNSPTVGTLSR